MLKARRCPQYVPHAGLAAQLTNLALVDNVVERAANGTQAANWISQRTGIGGSVPIKLIEIRELQTGGKGGTRALDPGIMRHRFTITSI